jgi:hypothetical protein
MSSVALQTLYSNLFLAEFGLEVNPGRLGLEELAFKRGMADAVCKQLRTVMPLGCRELWIFTNVSK